MLVIRRVLKNFELTGGLLKFAILNAELEPATDMAWLAVRAMFVTKALFNSGGADQFALGVLKDGGDPGR